MSQKTFGEFADRAKVAKTPFKIFKPGAALHSTVATVALVHILLGESALCADVPPIAPTVQDRIHDLGIRDDTVPYDERPEFWLWQRREQIVPQLIAGLDEHDFRVAKGSLTLLNQCAPSSAILNALLPIAANVKHPLNAAAMLALVRYGSDERASRLMAAAFTDPGRFPEPFDRAALAAAAGKNGQALAILSSVVAESEDESDAVRAVGQMAEIGPDAVPALSKASGDRKWTVAARALLALDRIDPQKHGLTVDQRQFLTETGRTFKADSEFYRQRAQELAALNRQQLRPLVMQALVSADYQAPRDALAILTIWQDKWALPEIRRLVANNPRSIRRDAMAACLAIDGGSESAQFLLQNFVDRSDFQIEEFFIAVLQASITNAQRVELLLKARSVVKDSPYILPHSLGLFAGDLAAVLPPLMDQETDIRALGMYAERAGADKQQRFEPQIVRAVHQLAQTAKSDPMETSELLSASQQILNAAAEQKSKQAEPDITELCAAKTPALRVAALSAAVRISGMLDRNALRLLDELSHPDPQIRRQVSQGLLGLNLTDEGQQRPQVERILLKHLGKPSEDYAMRLLVKFGGADSEEALLPILDDPQVSRAVYAAWVLAQFPQHRLAREAGMRRLAIHGLFHRYTAQQSSGIGFPVAADVRFTQVIERLNPNTEQGDRPVPQIPSRVLEPLVLTRAEQRFAIASYRDACANPDPYSLGSVNPAITNMNISDISLLDVIADEDPHLEALFVKNQPVAYFPDRHAAARQTALITASPAGYTGLAGETLSSNQTPPAPYPNQEALIARFAVDRVLRELPDHPPETDAQWNQINWRNSLLSNLAEHFGPQVRMAIVAEIRRRGLAKRFGQMRLVEQWLKD